MITANGKINIIAITNNLGKNNKLIPPILSYFSSNNFFLTNLNVIEIMLLLYYYLCIK